MFAPYYRPIHTTRIFNFNPQFNDIKPLHFHQHVIIRLKVVYFSYLSSMSMFSISFAIVLRVSSVDYLCYYQ